MRVPEITRSEGGAEGKGDTRRFQVNAERENEAIVLPRDELRTAVQRTGVVGGVTVTNMDCCDDSAGAWAAEGSE